MGKWENIGSFGVDSGQVLITDPCYLDDWEGNEYNADKIKKAQESGKYPYSYSGACGGAGKKGAGRIGQGCVGIVASTGHGDGEYPVLALFEKGKVKELKIVFF